MADDTEADQLLAQYAPPPLPDVRPRDMRTAPLGQSNLAHRVLSSFGQEAVDATREGIAGRRTPAEVAWTYFTTGPMGPLGSVRIPNPIRAYHGSPHDFDEFRLDKIGTGEGAQTYGHGLYFAEQPDVARFYRRHDGNSRTVGGQPFDSYNPQHLAADYIDAFGLENGIKQLTRDVASRTDHTRGRFAQALNLLRTDPQSVPPLSGPGRMYEVNLHARPEQFLDWAQPIGRQSPEVREALTDILQRNGAWGTNESFGPTGVAVQRHRFTADDNLPGRFAYERAHHSSPDERIRVLDEAGVRGIRYFDQGSRDAGQGTSNYVVFSPDIIEILRKYGIVAPVGGATTADILSQYGDRARGGAVAQPEGNDVASIMRRYSYGR